jgi:hypothetical protein
MKFVEFDRTTGRWDHRPLIAALPSISEFLPLGARSFINDPAHFDFRRYRVGEEVLPAGISLCPKDLLLIRVEIGFLDEGTVFQARFTFPGYPIERTDLFHP